MLGMPPKVIATIAPLHLFLQFWYHTRHIGKLGIVEYFIVTPSQHRVHHAINPEYIDKNMGQIFPWWDRLFGTFQEEMDEVPCVYGIKKPAATWNPILINYQHIWLLIKDAWRTNDYKAKFQIWFKPTGWRPKDVKEKYPVDIIENPITQKKYDTQASKTLHIWSWFQLIMTHVFLIYMLVQFEAIGFPLLFFYGGFMMVHIYAYTTLMDMNAIAVWVEVIKCAGGLYWIYSSNDWFGLNAYFDYGSYLMTAYFVLSLLGTIYFVTSEVRSPERMKMT